MCKCPTSLALALCPHLSFLRPPLGKSLHCIAVRPALSFLLSELQAGEAILPVTVALPSRQRRSEPVTVTAVATKGGHQWTLPRL